MEWSASCLFLILNGQHRQVVALLGIAYELMDGLGHLFYHVLGLVAVLRQQTTGYIPDALIAKLLVPGILCLVQPVGEEEDSGVGIDVDLLLREFEVADDADGQVGVAGQLAHVATHQQRGIVATITVVEHTSLKVEHTDKDGDEHIGVVALVLCFVQGFYDAVGLADVARYVAEQRARDSHIEGGGHTLA